MRSIRVPVRILLVSLAVGLVAYLVSFLLPKAYSATTSLYFPSSQSKAPTGLEALTGATGQSPDGGTISMAQGSIVSPVVGSGAQTTTGILTSRTCFLNVVEKLGLTKRWGISKWQAFDRLKRGVDVKTEKTGFLTINATLDDPELCKSVCDTLLAFLAKRSDELTVNVSKQNRKQMEKLVKEAQQEVADAKVHLDQARASKNFIDATQSTAAYVDARKGLESAKINLTAAKSRFGELKSLYAKLLDPNARYPLNVTALNLVVSNPGEAATAMKEASSALVNEIQSRRLALADTAKKYTKTSQEYREAERRLGTAETEAKKIIAVQQTQSDKGLRPEMLPVQLEIYALQQSIQAYNELVQKYEDKAKRAPSALSSAALLEADFEAAKMKYSKYAYELGMARMAEERDPARYEVVDAPIVEPSPVAPRKGIIALIAVLLAIAVQVAPYLMKNDDQRQLTEQSEA
ncbi:MAG: hypothetical protein JST40_13725 [Armatimonadetes bacterium]|nr:hypothetical protein [Armatimonadota bacterium]